MRRELGKPLVFGGVQLKVFKNWAVVGVATPLNPDFSEFNYRGSVSGYAKCIDRGGDDCGDPQYSAILKKKGSNWKVLKFGSGATDVGIGYDCSKMKGCPKELHY